MGFNQFKKELEARKNQNKTKNDLESSVRIWSLKRDQYLKEAKNALAMGDNNQYIAKTALLKNAMFNLSQSQDMLTNFTIAIDLYEAQKLNKNFVKCLNDIMKKVNSTSKSININDSKNIFTKGLYNSTQISNELKQMLQDNNIGFSSVINSLSDIKDEDIKTIIESELEVDNSSIEDSLKRLENNVFGNDDVFKEEKEVIIDGNESDNLVRNDEKDEKQEFENSKVSEKKLPEDEIISSITNYEFQWDNIPSVTFDDIAGLEDAKDVVKTRVLIPLKNPDILKGYDVKPGAGICLYGPSGTGKTMFAAAVAHEIGAKFCSLTPSLLLKTGQGNSERAVKQLFKEARSFPCAVVYFDEFDSIAPKKTMLTTARQFRSEFLAQIQGMESYETENSSILLLIGATNKPWDVDPAFLRPMRFGTKVYVGLPNETARRIIIEKTLNKIENAGLVDIRDIDIDYIVKRTNGFNGADCKNLMDVVQSISLTRANITKEKFISIDDFENALSNMSSSTGVDELNKLKEWTEENAR